LEDFPVEGSPIESPAVEDAALAGSTSQEAGQGEAGRTGPIGRRPDPRAFGVEARLGEPIVTPNPRARLRSASPGRWRNIALGLGLALAILVGATGHLLFSALNRGSAAAGGTGSPAASAATATPSRASEAPATPGLSATPGATSTAGPTSTAGASSTATDTPTVAPQGSGAASPATVTFRDLMLDSAADSGGVARTFAFTSDGPGSVSAQIVAAAPLATVKICIQANGGPQSCSSGATPGFFTMAPPAADQAQWTVTLIATDAGATPVVDVAFTWQTKSPAITLSHGRFQGAPNPDSLRGFTATFKTRAAGSVGVVASWPPASADAVLTLTDVTASPGSAVGQVTYRAAGSISPAYSGTVAAGRTYQIQVLNTGSDSGRPDLTTTISFP
jgi:hypothetical protein